mgnify:CR=1 FL=1
MARRQAAAAIPVSKKKAKKGAKVAEQKSLTLKEMLTVTKTEKTAKAA